MRTNDCGVEMAVPPKKTSLDIIHDQLVSVRLEIVTLQTENELLREVLKGVGTELCDKCKKARRGYNGACKRCRYSGVPEGEMPK